MLNLVELVGQATPLIINHGMGQKISSGHTLSRHRIQLSVIRLVPSEVSEENWDAVLDREILRETKILSRKQSNIVYREETTSDGGNRAI